MRILLAGIYEHDPEIGGLLAAATTFTAGDAGELVESVYGCAPDVIVVDRALPGLSAALRQIAAVLPAPVVVIARREDDTAPLALEETDVFAYLVRPVHPAALQRAVLVAREQFHRLERAHDETVQLREALAARKTIERAKGLLMQRHRLDEAQAYAALREESRRQRRPLAEIAHAMLDAEAAPAPAAGVRKVRLGTPGGRESAMSPVVCRITRGASCESETP